jgi:hypothetical protein
MDLTEPGPRLQAAPRDFAAGAAAKLSPVRVPGLGRRGR